MPQLGNGLFTSQADKFQQRGTRQDARKFSWLQASKTSISDIHAGKHEAVVLSVGSCKFTNLYGDLYLQYSVTQKKLYIKSKTPCPIRFLTTGQYLLVVVHVFFDFFSVLVHVSVIYDSLGA